MVSLASQFQMLRVRIENSMQAPFSLLVSSASTRDGKSVCTKGLADCMAAAGYRTLLVDLNHDSPSSSRPSAVRSLTTANDLETVIRSLTVVPETGVSVLSLTSSSLSGSASRENVAITLKRLREMFDAIIIDGATLITSSIGVLFASQCDAVLLTAREGRSIKNDDHLTLNILEREGATFFGVVTVSADAIRKFHDRSKERTEPIAVPFKGMRKSEATMAATRVS